MRRPRKLCTPPQNHGAQQANSIVEVQMSVVSKVIGAIILCGCSNVFGDTLNESQLKNEGRQLLREILDQRMRLTSGVFRFRGEKFNSEGPPIPEVRGPVSGLVAFDHDRERFRFDSEQPMFVTSISSSTSETTEGIERPMLRWIQTPEFTADWTKTTRSNVQYVHVRKPGNVVETSAVLYPFDVREAGLIHYMQFEKNPGLQKTIEAFLELKVVEIRDLENDRKCLVLETRWGRFELVIDLKRGMTVTELRVIEPDVTFPGRETAALVEWEQRNGVWIPKKYRIEWQTGDEYRDHRYYDLTFDWQSVNEPVAETLFDFHQLEGIPDGTEIVDVRTDPQKVIGKYGRDISGSDRSNPAAVGNWKRWLVLLNVFLLLVAFSWYWFQRSKTNKGVR